MSNKFLLGLLLAASLPVGSCGAVTGLGSAVNGSTGFCEHSIKDEQAVVAVNAAYKGFRLGVETGVRAGFIKGELAGKIAAVDNKAFAAILSLDTVYRTCNGDLGAALTSANNAISEGITLASRSQ